MEKLQSVEPKTKTEDSAAIKNEILKEMNSAVSEAEDEDEN